MQQLFTRFMLLFYPFFRKHFKYQINRSLIIFFCLFTGSVSAQTVQSPDDFLGYKSGSRFTPSEQAHSYFKYLAGVLPGKVKYKRYGSSYENKPLGVSIVSSEENIKNLDEIRTSNLKRAGLLSGEPMANQPAILYLSYNVHGNEAVATETALRVLYDLATSKDVKVIEWLNKVVIIIDPCLNPDGHDRYVNFYTQSVGKNFNSNPAAKEHHEPWPGGRFNHYLFDPNRDWAWQTQKETVERVAFYHEWMPEVHADFHEMGASSPYYFAPAAKPYHDVITEWQKKLQNEIAESNKKHFDEHNWLYYTREQFDLFYPGYGDTYPIYNGAVGLTYEQGGSGVAGLALSREKFGDTLTLFDRISHHYEASIATLEAVSNNSEKSVKNFSQYFSNAKSNPPGEYKTYIFKSKGAEGSIQSLTELLDKHKIAYSYANESRQSAGFRYNTTKNETFKVENGDLLISSYQNQSNLIKVLFEPKSMLEDSVTYDLTAWSLPYAYGLETYATKERLALKTSNSSTFEAKKPTISKPYAYFVKWNSLQSVQFLTSLLNKNIQTRYTETSFEMNGEKFEPGTLIITRTGNERLGADFDKIVISEAANHKVVLNVVSSGYVTVGSDFGSDNIHVIKVPKIGILSGDSISPTAFGDVWHFFDQQIDYQASVIDINYFGKLLLSKFDILIFPSGKYDGLKDEKIEELNDWVKHGGKLILLDNALLTFAGKPGFELKKKEDKKAEIKPDSYENIKEYGKREREKIMEEIPGSIYKVEMDNTHPLAFGYNKTFNQLKYNAEVFQFLKKGWNVGVLKTNAHLAGFTGSKTKAKLENCLVFGVQDSGAGKIIYMTDSPLLRGFWHGGKLIFGNAVFMVGN